MKWKKFSLTCLLLLVGSRLLWAEGLNSNFAVGAEGALVINAKSGKVLYDKNSHVRCNPASTTKIAVALVVLQHYRDRLDEIMTCDRDSLASITPQEKKQSNYRSPPHWLETDASHMGLKRGEELSLFDLLKGMMVVSADDAANVIAKSLGGTVANFMEEVNHYLRGIGCCDTQYNNPHGLHHPDHITTAYDLALMAKEALKDPIFREMVAMPRFICPQTNFQLERTLPQTNQLLKKSGPYYYPKAIGIKTGNTQAAGKNLVAAAQSDDREIIVVALGYRGVSARAELYQDVIKLFDAVFSEKKLRQTILKKGEQKLSVPIKGASGPLQTYLDEDLNYEFYPSEKEPVKLSILWQIPPLPLAQGAAVGSVRIIDEAGNQLFEKTLFASQPLAAKFSHRCSALVTQHPWHTLGVCLILTLFFFKLSRPKKTSYR